jgi:hypothetical protein
MAALLQLTDAGLAAVTGPAGSAAAVIAELGLTATAFDFAPTLNALPGEFKRLTSVAGAAAGPNLVHLEAFDNSADIWTATGLALYLDDGTLFAALGADEPVLAKASLAYTLVALDVSFNADIAANITFGDLVFMSPPATTENRGLIEIATQAETDAGEDEQRAVTPASGKAAATTWLFERDLVLGAVDVQTPNIGSTGGLRVRGNSVSGKAYFQFTSDDLAEWGFAVVDAAGCFDWRGVGGLRAGGTPWVGNVFNGPIGVGGDFTILGGADLRIESQFPGYPVSLIYNDRGTLAFHSNGWERGLFGESGEFHLKGTRQFPNQSTIAGNGNLRVWTGQAGGVAVSTMDTVNYTAIEFLRQVLGVVQNKGGITVDDFGTTYGSNSDHRLKEDLQPVTGAIDRMMAIELWDVRWSGTERRSTAYIAHDLAAHIPHAVTGKKDAVRQVETMILAGKRALVDATGEIIEPAVDPVTRIDTVPEYQNVDPGKVVPDLHAAFQELVRMVRAQGEELAALKSARRKRRSAT